MLHPVSAHRMHANSPFQTLASFVCLFHTSVETNQWMVGSYGPKTEPSVYTTPEEDTPSGMISRGHYTVKSQFIDDDKHSYLDWEWAFDIKKEWGE